MKKIRNWSLILLFLIAGAIYLLLPKGSDSFALVDDPKAIAEKQAYLASVKKRQSGNKPNIILITVDDLGMADCSLYGLGEIETPHMDKFGSEGVVLKMPTLPRRFVRPHAPQYLQAGINIDLALNLPCTSAT